MTNIFENDWWIYGEVNNEGYPKYSQGKIDVFNNWQKVTTFDWFSIPKGSKLKLDYIGACLTYSGMANKVLEKDVYQFNVRLVKEERDIFYIAAMEIIGDRGYMGHDFHTFRDCMIELYNYHGYFNNKRVIFSGMEHVLNPEISLFLELIKEEFSKLKFVLE